MTCVGHYKNKSPIYGSLQRITNTQIHMACQKMDPCIYSKNFRFNVIIFSTTYTKYTFLAHKFHYHFPLRKSWSTFSSIACNSTIVSNKQRRQHDNLATIQRANLGFVKAQNPNANPNKNGQGSHYHMTTWMMRIGLNYHIYCEFFFIPQGPLLYIYLYFKTKFFFKGTN